MNSLKQFRLSLSEKSGKKLVAFSVSVFLLTTAIVFFTLYFSRGIQLDLMDGYFAEIPKIIDSRSSGLKMRSRVYEEDILARAELGLKLFEERNEGTDAAELELLRSRLTADSVSLLGENRQILASTGPLNREETFLACIRELEPRVPYINIYPAVPKDGEESEGYDGKGCVLVPIPGNAKRSLVFEFNCDTMLELYNTLINWPGVFEHLLNGREFAAFAKTGDKLSGYAMDELAPEQLSQLQGELARIFRDSGSFHRAENRRSGKLITLLGRPFLAKMTHYAESDTDILLACPLSHVFSTGIYGFLSILAIIACGIVLFLLYAFYQLLRKRGGKDADMHSAKWVHRVTRPGILVVLVVTVVFSTMLLHLESRSNAAISAAARRESLQHEIDWYEGQKDEVRSSFTALYRARTQILADFLADHPEHQTREGLKELSDIAGTDYLMRFDSSGQELVSSNSYTGFSVGANLSEEYRAVLMGYPSAVAGPEADPYTGRMQLGTAILMTDGEGRNTGFLLAVYSSAELNAQLESMRYENIVNSASVQKGHAAAAISNEDGCFIAHTDPGMIGLSASYLMPYVEPGISYEGFTQYNGDSMYVSASSTDGKTLLYMVPNRADSAIKTTTVLMLLAVLLVLALLFYPTAGVLSARAIEEADAKGSLQAPDVPGNPMMVFPVGYILFLTLLAFLALAASLNGRWPTFVYVFSGSWSRGVHLFSLWAALFVLAFTLCLVLLIRTVIKLVQDRLSIRTRTITMVADSLISYVAAFFLFFCILDMFGVNTTALLASAGIVSIAVGMGAQSMASDLLAGFFMMLEGSIHVGDHVSVGGITGHVTNMGIRTTEITDDDGNVMILNNSQVGSVLNMSRKEEQEAAPDGKAQAE